jgi:hypothetical protein
LGETGIEISLSAKGFRNLPGDVWENDFGENRFYCPSFLASFLSPRICDLQKKGSTLREFYIETKEPTHSFEKLLQVRCGFD